MNMQYPSRKQSWLEFINESMGSYIKNEALDRPMNGGMPTNQGNHHYDLNSKSLYQTSAMKRPTANINHKQQQQHHSNDLENSESKFP